MPLTLEESIQFLDKQVNIRDQKLLADYNEMTHWALNIGNQPSLIKTVANPTIGKSSSDLRFTLITETGIKKKNFLIFKSRGNLQLYIPSKRETGLSSFEYKYKRINGNIIEFDAVTATDIPIDDKKAIASLAYCLLIEKQHGSEIDSCLDVLRSDLKTPSTETTTHRSCFQPTAADWDQTLALLSKDSEKVKIEDVFNKIENKREEDGDTLCPGWQEILTEELKQRG